MGELIGYPKKGHRTNKVTSPNKDNEEPNSQTVKFDLSELERFSKKLKLDEPISDRAEQDAIIRRLKQNGLVENEHWPQSVSIEGRIAKVEQDYVECDCLIDKERQNFQLRKFPRKLFEVIPELKIGVFVYIKIKTKPGSSRIDVYKGEGIVNPELFDLNDIWESLENSGIDAPFNFENENNF